MFLLVLACPGSPRQRSFKWLCVYVCADNSAGNQPKWSLVRKGGSVASHEVNDGAALAYVDGGNIVTLVSQNMAASTCTAQGCDDDGDAHARRLRRVACSCPNCKEGIKK